MIKLIRIFETKVKKQKSDYFRQLEEIERKYSVLPNQKKREELIAEEKQKLSKKSGFDLENIEKQLREFSSKKKTRPFFPWKLYFVEVFEKGGFDVVIGNPPWVSNDSIDNSQKKIYKQTFSYSAMSRYDLSCLFVELSIEKLVNQNGIALLVLPEHLWIGEYYTSLREAVFSRLQEVDSLKEGIFDVVNNPASIMVVQSQGSDAIRIGKYHNEQIQKVYILTKADIQIDTQRNSYGKDIKPYRIYFDPRFLKMKKKIFRDTEGILLLDDITEVTDGVQTAKFLKQIMTNVHPDDPKKYIKALRSGKEIPFRYGVPQWSGWWMLKPEYTSKFKQPGFSYDSPKRMFCFKQDRKIILRQTEPTIFATIDENKYYFPNSIFQIAVKEEYSKRSRLEFLLGLLNSKLLRFYYQISSQVAGTTKPQIYINQLKSLPIVLTSGNKIDEVVDNIFAITKSSNYLESPEKQARVEEYQRQIDQMVYELYKLGDEEIAIVEGKNE